MVPAVIYETERLYTREMSAADLPSLKKILQDEAAMYACNGAFTDEKTLDWLNRQLARYRDDGFGLRAVVLKDAGEMIGQCGLTLQDANGAQVLEIGYLLQRAFWHNGYAAEAAA
jgi:RimJ/RimL family protein N-acetyltransferase